MLEAKAEPRGSEVDSQLLGNARRGGLWRTCPSYPPNNRSHLAQVRRKPGNRCTMAQPRPSIWRILVRGGAPPPPERTDDELT
jgi:hypothetical protein